MSALPVGRGVPRDMFPIYRCLMLMNVLTFVHGLPFECGLISQCQQAFAYSLLVVAIQEGLALLPPVPDGR